MEKQYPFTSVFINAFGLPKFVADWLSVLAVLVLCFLVGTLVATRLGRGLAAMGRACHDAPAGLHHGP